MREGNHAFLKKDKVSPFQALPLPSKKFFNSHRTRLIVIYKVMSGDEESEFQNNFFECFCIEGEGISYNIFNFIVIKKVS